MSGLIRGGHTSPGRDGVAIVHDYLTQRGGAERVVLSMLKAFPGAPLHVSLYEPEMTFPEFRRHDVRTSAVNRIGALRRNHRLGLPLYAPAFSRMHVPADVVVCSSSGWAHGVRTGGRKIVYCHLEARWLYQSERYLGRGHRLAGTGLRLLRPPLMRWDRKAAASADRYLVPSRAVRSRIRSVYGIEPEVLPPPWTIDPDGEQAPVPGLEPGFFLCAARLVPYKNVDAVIEAFGGLPLERLVVAGTGPEEQRLRAIAPPNVRLLGEATDEQLRWLYANCAGVVGAAYEDFGLTPLEGAAFGKPAAVLRHGGFLDTIIEDVTGVFFDMPSSQEIRDAVRRLSMEPFEEEKLRTQAAIFAEPEFIRRLRQIVADAAHAEGREETTASSEPRSSPPWGRVLGAMSLISPRG